MKVSVITATYNSEKTILDTVKSLDGQTYENIEYIIVDGASIDSTIKIINDNCTRISHIVNEPDKGIYDALNKGLRFATGDIVGFLHSDDLFASKDVIKNLVFTLKSAGADAVYGDLKYVEKEDTSKIVRFWRSGKYSRARLKNGWMPPHPTFFMKRDLYAKFGFFDLDFYISADYDSLLRYLWVKNVSMAYLPEVITLMRVGGASNRSLANIIQKTKEDVSALKKNNVPIVKAILCKNLSKVSQFIFK